MSKKQRKTISLDEKSKIIGKKNAGQKTINIALSMGLAPSTVRTICTRDQLKIKESVLNLSSSFSKNVTKSRHAIIERMESLLIWIQDKNKRRLILSQIISNLVIADFRLLIIAVPSANKANSTLLRCWGMSDVYMLKIRFATLERELGERKYYKNVNWLCAMNVPLFSKMVWKLSIELCKTNKMIMGGVVVVLAGEFWQTLPVIPQGTMADELKACLKSSCLWRKVKTLKLNTMRVYLKKKIDAGRFASQLVMLGNGDIVKEPNTDSH